MEERMSWSEAFGTAWGNLTGVNNEGGSIRTVRLLFFLIFILGTAWAGYNYHKAQILLEPKVIIASTPAVAVEADQKRLDDMISQVKTTTEMRSSSPYLARSMGDVLSKYPFGDPMMVVKPEGELKPGDIVVTVPEIIIDYPPEGIMLRAIMIMGNQRVAVMDIPGVGSGLVVKAGDTFMQKKGRIVRIAPDKVVVRWGSKNWDIAPGF